MEWVDRFKPSLNTVMTFDNHSAQGQIDFWQPFPIRWRGEGIPGARNAAELDEVPRRGPLHHLNPKPQTLNPQPWPQTLNPDLKPLNLNPKPLTFNP